jgi:hypothetical protein
MAASMGMMRLYLQRALAIRSTRDLGEEAEEILGILAGEHAGFGGEAVLESVAAGFSFAFRGFRPGGLLRISAICVYLRLRCHMIDRLECTGRPRRLEAGDQAKCLKMEAQIYFAKA